MAISTAGRTVTEIRNQVCSTNSAHENRRWTIADTVDQTASRSIANRSPTIPRAETTLRPASPVWLATHSTDAGIGGSRLPISILGALSPGPFGVGAS